MCVLKYNYHPSRVTQKSVITESMQHFAPCGQKSRLSKIIHFFIRRSRALILQNVIQVLQKLLLNIVVVVVVHYFHFRFYLVVRKLNQILGFNLKAARNGRRSEKKIYLHFSFQEYKLFNMQRNCRRRIFFHILYSATRLMTTGCPHNDVKNGFSRKLGR